MFNRGVNETTQKCHNSIAPVLQQGVIGLSQQCHAILAPALFWRHHKFAEMPALDRANGKGH